MNNTSIYDQVRAVPKEAQKPIIAGRLKGKTDINPMWRIRKLTELFGPVGIGWYYDIDREWLDPGADGEVTAHVQISLYTKHENEWSHPIRGIGGSALVAKEKSGMYTDDDCYKKALTDALSVACKALGMGADVYWDKDPSKYIQREPTQPEPQPEPPICAVCGVPIGGIKTNEKSYTPEEVAEKIKAKHGRVICKKCQDVLQEEEYR